MEHCTFWMFNPISYQIIILNGRMCRNTMCTRYPPKKGKKKCFRHSCCPFNSSLCWSVDVCFHTQRTQINTDISISKCAKDKAVKKWLDMTTNVNVMATHCEYPMICNMWCTINDMKDVQCTMCRPCQNSHYTATAQFNNSIKLIFLKLWKFSEAFVYLADGC